MAKNDAPNGEKKPRHKATYSTDKRNGGYLVRVIGPDAGKFAGREIPVTRRDNGVSTETLDRLIWTGIDKGTEEMPGTGLPAALYKFKAKPRDEKEVVPF